MTEACRRAGLGPGGRALDLGCGPLGALETLAGIVGPEGSVVGVDADDVALGTASAILQRLGTDGVRLLRADVNELTPDSSGIAGFDLAFCRLVLMHQQDPAHTMARIAGERGQFFPIPAAAVVPEAAVLLAGARVTIETNGLCSSAEVDGLLAALQTDQLPAGTTAYSPQSVELIARTPLGGPATKENQP